MLTDIVYCDICNVKNLSTGATVWWKDDYGKMFAVRYICSTDCLNKWVEFSKGMNANFQIGYGILHWN